MRFCRQFWLLFRKNLLLMRRNKLWTAIEFVVPLVILLAVAYLIKVVNDNKIDMKFQATTFKRYQVKGTYADVYARVQYIPTIATFWGGKSELKIAYTKSAAVKKEEVDELMKAFADRFRSTERNSRLIVTAKYFEDETTLESALRNDLKQNRTEGGEVGEFAGGLVFDELNFSTRRLNYRIRISHRATEFNYNWHMDDTWIDAGAFGPVFEPIDVDKDPPYWTSGFLAFQMAVDSLFINKAESGNWTDPLLDVPSEVFFRRIPEPTFEIDPLAGFLKYLPYFWAIFAFPLLIHSGREFAAECESGVKSYLAVMGLDVEVFFAAHIFLGWLKCFIIFTFGVIPLLIAMPNVNPFLFLFVVYLFGLAVVCLSILIAAIFRSPNSSLKVMVVMWGGLFVVAAYQPDSSQVFLAHVASLNLLSAFKYACDVFSDYVTRKRSLSFVNMFDESTIHMSLGSASIMLLVDVIWMVFVAYVIDHMAESRLDELFWSCLQRPDSSNSNGRHVGLEGSEEVDSGLVNSSADIVVEDLTKIWSNGDRAVDRLSLKAYRGQVTVLLGHNGAGKSTTFNMICGLVRPSSGSVEVCGSTSPRSGSVGLCPQQNALFDKLTVQEHLWFYEKLKLGSASANDEIREILSRVELSEKRNELAMNLSGGQKRKLCVGMALIGNSQVVLLDEPTAGMDPSARRDVQKLLEEKKEDRTILLTTHYMDEAEVLGDRVAILVKGHLVCSGSTQFLKKRFGTGYILTAVFEEGTEVDTANKASQLTALTRRHVRGASTATVQGRQAEVVLPRDEQDRFPELFNDLEGPDGKKIGMVSFGLSLNTLEQVFLRVGEMADPEENVTDGRAEVQPLISSAYEERLRGLDKIFAQFTSLLHKRFIYSIRNPGQLIAQLLIPLVLLLLTVWIVGSRTSVHFNQKLKLSFDHLSPSKVPAQSDNGSEQFTREVKAIVERVAGFEYIPLDWSANFTKFILEQPKTLPTTVLGVVYDQTTIEALFNGRAYHALPTALSLANNARLGRNGSISTTLQLYEPIWLPKEDEGLLSASIMNIILGPLIVLMFAFLTSTYVMFLVAERTSKFAHQQYLTGVSPAVFWGASLLYDFLIYVTACIIFLVIIRVVGWMEGHVIDISLLWLLYFVSVAPLIYSISFIFASSSKANVLLVLWQIFSAIFCFVVAGILKTGLLGFNADVQALITTAMMFAVPSFGLGYGMVSVAASGPEDHVWSWDALGRVAAALGVTGIIASIIFVALQFKSVRRQLSLVWDDANRRLGRHNYSELGSDDVDVSNERTSVNETDARNWALKVTNLHKFYGRNHAVNNVTFGVKEKECFGLLGVNGAGKTTTFDIVTGRTFQSEGDAFVGGRDVAECISLGYCPQNDALLLQFTGRETLEIIAKMHGFPDPRRKAEVVLESVHMKQHADKLIRNYSGGQRRRLSVGLALLSGAKLVILDEPTAGIDPKARRDIWKLLSTVRENGDCALLLTSHSMDECEALCSRIAVLQRGRLVAIGTAQWLKHRFGNSYTLTMVVPADLDKQKIISAVAANFPNAQLKSRPDSASRTLIWQVPREKTDRWSQVFRRVQSLARLQDIAEYAVSQSSLEETFLRLADTEEDTVTV